VYIHVALKIIEDISVELF